jgi:hypothetical protein
LAISASTSAQVAHELQAFIDLGVERLIVRLVDFPSTAGLELFACEVISLLRS